LKKEKWILKSGFLMVKRTLKNRKGQRVGFWFRFGVNMCTTQTFAPKAQRVQKVDFIGEIPRNIQVNGSIDH
jgi:hypothetical protein